jgi:hypothetical protein
MFINRWIIAIVLYLIVTSIIVLVKPSLMFTMDGNVKEWSSENTDRKSVFSPMIVFPMLAILCYYLGIWIEVLSN